MTDRMATLTVEFGCTRSCQVEFDLADVHTKYSYGQMLRTVETAHLDAHKREAVKVFQPTPDVIVRAVALAEAAVR